jgi:hypothetical protein
MLFPARKVNSLPKRETIRLPHTSCLLFLVILMAPAISSSHLTAQTKAESTYYSRANTYAVFFAYSPDSSHMLLGSAEHRMLLDIGASYSRRLFLNHAVNWQYSGELLPVALESDPLSRVVENQTTPAIATYTYDQGPVVDCAPASAPYVEYLENGAVFSAGTYTLTCYRRRWTIGEAMSPVGFQWNFLPGRKTQPFFVGHGGSMYSTQPIPMPDAGSFNFTCDLGAGLEFYRSKTKSIRAELRYHHISNHGTALENPGIDNLLYQVTYSFGH